MVDLSTEMILELADLYRILVYPIFCYFHWPSFIHDVKSRRHEQDRAFYATVLAVCAIVAARLRDGACNQLYQASPSSPSSPAAQAERIASLVDPEKLHRAALASIPSDSYEASLSFDYLRATALLAILGMQNGDFQQLQVQLGRYLGLAALQGFHDEAQWPQGVSEVERQERRRLYWSTYTLDVFAAMVWNGVVRHREMHSLVAYPDEEFELRHSGIHEAGSSTHAVSWVRGWNLVTDLYRILEHTLDTITWDRRNASMDRFRNLPHPIAPASVPIESVMPLVDQLYMDLPQIFKQTKVMTGDSTVDMYSFQAANIIVTLQTVKMAVSCSGTVSMAERCNIAGELLDALANIPTAYMQAISAPFLHHLAGIGNLLGSVVQSPLTISAYLQTRQILLAFADLLASLETSLKFAAGTSARLSRHVARIDAFMQSAAAAKRSDRGVYHADAFAHARQQQEEEAATVAVARAGREVGRGEDVVVNQQQQDQLPPPSSTYNGHPPETSSASASLSWNPTTNDFASWAAMMSPGQLGDTEMTLPDDLLLNWPFDTSQGTVFDSFFGAA